MLSRMDAYQTTPYQTTTLPKWMFLQELFLQIILAAKWLVRHSSKSPKLQRRAFPSLCCINPTSMSTTHQILIMIILGCLNVYVSYRVVLVLQIDILMIIILGKSKKETSWKFQSNNFYISTVSIIHKLNLHLISYHQLNF